MQQNKDDKSKILIRLMNWLCYPRESGCYGPGNSPQWHRRNYGDEGLAPALHLEPVARDFFWLRLKSSAIKYLLSLLLVVRLLGVYLNH